MFPPEEDAKDDPVAQKKLEWGEAGYSTTKCLLGFDFDGDKKMVWLEEMLGYKVKMWS